MKQINFFSIEDNTEPGRQGKSKIEGSKPIQFFELSDTGEPSAPPTSVVENIVHHEDAVSFFEIADISDDAGDEPGSGESSTPSAEEGGEEDPRKEGSSKIMVVEDDNIVSTMLKHLLERRGFSIDIASDGRRASDMIDTETPPALVILDVMLPFVDGFELIRKIRSKKNWNDVPIIMLTAKTRETDIVRALESGADDYVVKPFQPQELIARVKRFVRK